jgi:hypothetical protein
MLMSRLAQIVKMSGAPAALRGANEAGFEAVRGDFQGDACQDARNGKLSLSLKI